MNARSNRQIGILGLLFAAALWGAMWYPYRWLHTQGLTMDLAQIANYVIAILIGGVLLFGVLKRPWEFNWRVALMGLSAGWSNVSYVFAVLHGEVMRISLLFYLAPVWTLILAWIFLGEKPNKFGWLVFAFSFAGAACMLWQPSLGLPLPQTEYEWAALSGGVCFALNNVQSRQIPHIDPAVKSFSVWCGCLLMAVGAMFLFDGQPAKLLDLSASVWLVLLLIGGALVIASLGMQFALRYIGATEAMVIMLFELVVAAVSAWWLAGEVLSLREWTGGAMILAGSLFSGQLAHTEEEHA
ncbi:DMT family transporter [Leeia sp. TBRC 13508]|uniref:DMT family transporter n=1 Tax=Leeia speluncae TaxID=2884804 RepID=A0ABS8D1Z3_9NEIS|nr:DMT family transporter [Leeia speluncae]MCB6182221.1 DMT family transporter [Leeia speluncae]